jgi:hypothetical protein
MAPEGLNEGTKKIHIVIYDNNQVKSGVDHDVTEMLAPFVAG